MRWVVGLLLVCGSILKVVQAITEPAVMLTSGRYYLPLQVGVELGVGLWRNNRYQ